MVDCTAELRSLALSCLGRPNDAKFCLEKAIADGCKDKTLPAWQSKIEKAAAAGMMSLQMCFNVRLNHPEINGKITVLEIPHLSDVVSSQKTNQNQSIKSESAGSQNEMPVAVPPIYKKPNHEWYQTSNTVIITVYVKNIPRDKCAVEFNSRSVSQSSLRAWT